MGLAKPTDIHSINNIHNLERILAWTRSQKQYMHDKLNSNRYQLLDLGDFYHNSILHLSETNLHSKYINSIDEVLTPATDIEIIQLQNDIRSKKERIKSMGGSFNQGVMNRRFYLIEEVQRLENQIIEKILFPISKQISELEDEIERYYKLNNAISGAKQKGSLLSINSEEGQARLKHFMSVIGYQIIRNKGDWKKSIAIKMLANDMLAKQKVNLSALSKAKQIRKLDTAFRSVIRMYYAYSTNKIHTIRKMLISAAPHSAMYAAYQLAKFWHVEKKDAIKLVSEKLVNWHAVKTTSYCATINPSVGASYCNKQKINYGGHTTCLGLLFDDHQKTLLANDRTFHNERVKVFNDIKNNVTIREGEENLFEKNFNAIFSMGPFKTLINNNALPYYIRNMRDGYKKDFQSYKEKAVEIYRKHLMNEFFMLSNHPEDLIKCAYSKSPEDLLNASNSWIMRDLFQREMDRFKADIDKENQYNKLNNLESLKHKQEILARSMMGGIPILGQLINVGIDADLHNWKGLAHDLIELGAFATGPFSEGLSAAIFLGDMAWYEHDAIKDLKKAYESGDKNRINQSISNLSVNTVGMIASGAALVSRGTTFVKENLPKFKSPEWVNGKYGYLAGGNNPIDPITIGIIPSNDNHMIQIIQRVPNHIVEIFTPTEARYPPFNPGRGTIINLFKKFDLVNKKINVADGIYKYVLTHDDIDKIPIPTHFSSFSAEKYRLFVTPKRLNHIDPSRRQHPNPKHPSLLKDSKKVFSAGKLKIELNKIVWINGYSDSYNLTKSSLKILSDLIDSPYFDSPKFKENCIRIFNARRYSLLDIGRSIARREQGKNAEYLIDAFDVDKNRQLNPGRYIFVVDINGNILFNRDISILADGARPHPVHSALLIDSQKVSSAGTFTVSPNGKIISVTVKSSEFNLKPQSFNVARSAFRSLPKSSNLFVYDDEIFFYAQTDLNYN